MASDQVSGSVLAPPAAPQVPPLQAWLARLGRSGKILAIGGLVGVIAVFLPLLSMSVQVPDFAKTAGAKGATNVPAISSSQSVMVVSDWRGTVCLIGYFGAAALAILLYPPNGLAQKTLAWAGVGVGGLIALLALWLLFLALNGSSGLSAFGGSFKVSVGIGAILNLLASAAVAAGGVLKAREEKLF